MFDYLACSQTLIGDIATQETQIKKLLDKAKTTIDQASVISDVEVLRSRCVDVEDKWSESKNDAVKLSKRLSVAIKSSDAYQTQLANVTAWLNIVEDRLRWQGDVSCDRDSALKQGDRNQVAVERDFAVRPGFRSAERFVRRTHENV